MSQFVCGDCREEIAAEASTCPYCGHKGQTGSGIVAVCAVLFGGILTMTIIGAVVGIPMVLWGLRGLKKQGERSPAVKADAQEDSRASSLRS
jgi:uncharacterized membrane protein